MRKMTYWRPSTTASVNLRHCFDTADGHTSIDRFRAADWSCQLRCQLVFSRMGESLLKPGSDGNRSCVAVAPEHIDDVCPGNKDHGMTVLASFFVFFDLTIGDVG